MNVTFSCDHCKSSFTVDAQLAGRMGCCRHCGRRMVVPAVSEQPAVNARRRESAASVAAASASLRMRRPAASQSSQPEPSRLEEGSLGRKNVSDSQLSLKPLTIDSLSAVRARKSIETEESGTSYNVVIPRDVRKKLEGGGAFGAVRAGYRKGVKSYRQFFDVLARMARWISETSYEWSFVFVILAIAGGMSSRHSLTVFALNAIVFFNVVALVGGLVALEMLAFREGLARGLLCLIPPLTAIYMWKIRARYPKTIQRITAPLIILCLVVFAYAFVPWLSGNQPRPATLGGRIKQAVESIEHNVGESTSEMTNKAEAFQEKMPAQMDKAKSKLGEIEEKAKVKLDEWKDKASTRGNAATRDKAADGPSRGNAEKPAENRDP